MPPRQRVLQNLFLIFTVLPCCSSLHVSIPKKEYEIARGGDVTMTCSFVPAKPELSFYVLTWEASPDKAGEPMKPVATEYMNQVTDIAPPYEGRVTIKTDINQRTSTLTISRVTSQDNRNYQCSVKIPNDDEGTTAATTSLLVLVAPSPPICDIEGEAEYFQDIKITCKSEEGSPAPTYGWKSYSVTNKPRPFPPKTVQKDGVLSLFNITRDTSGFFICTSTNRIASASCNYTLAVMPPTNSTAVTFGIVAGVIAAVVLLAVLGYCLYQKKSKKKAAQARPPTEMEFHDGDTTEVGEAYTDQN